MQLLKRVLLIDDDNDDADIFKEALAETGLNAIFNYMSDGYTAYKMLVSNTMDRPDVIFLDINMPTFDGWACLKALKDDQLLQTIPVIMYSTASQERDKHTAKGLGASDFLTKPNSYKDLRNKLTEIIEAL